jgi:hypothetical protein
MQKSLISIHLWLAAFFLPIAVMFATTGALYTVSIKGSYEETSRPITLAEPLTPELSALTGILRAPHQSKKPVPPSSSSGRVRVAMLC